MVDIKKILKGTKEFLTSKLMLNIYILLIILCVFYIGSLGHKNLEVSSNMNENINGEYHTYYFKFEEKNKERNITTIGSFNFYYDFTKNYGKISFKSQELKKIMIRFPKSPTNVEFFINNQNMSKYISRFENSNEIHINLDNYNYTESHNENSNIYNRTNVIKFNSTIKPSGIFKLTIDSKTNISPSNRNVFFDFGNNYTQIGNGVYDLINMKKIFTGNVKEIDLMFIDNTQESGKHRHSFELTCYNNIIRKDKNRLESFGVGMIIASIFTIISTIITFLFQKKP